MTIKEQQVNCFFIKEKLTDDPNDPIRLEAKELLGEFTEIKILKFHLFMKKGTEHEQVDRIRFLKMCEEEMTNNSKDSESDCEGI